MIFTMKKGSATADQSKRRTNNTRQLSLPLNYHWHPVLSMVKCQECGGEGNLIGRVCERCLVEDRSVKGATLRLITVPMEG